jgi:hypothetical protein
MLGRMFYKKTPNELIEYRLAVKPFDDVYLKKFKLLKKHVQLVTKVPEADRLAIRQEILDDIKENTK